RRRGRLDERARAVLLAPSWTARALPDPPRTRQATVLGLEVHRRECARRRDHRLAREAALAAGPAECRLHEEGPVAVGRLTGRRAVASDALGRFDLRVAPVVDRAHLVETRAGVGQVASRRALAAASGPAVDGL